MNLVAWLSVDGVVPRLLAHVSGRDSNVGELLFLSMMSNSPFMTNMFAGHFH